ncbi:MAG: hypothetical protein WC890_05925 [Candidatus Margulisiibacteriota bacterium]
MAGVSAIPTQLNSWRVTLKFGDMLEMNREEIACDDPGQFIPERDDSKEEGYYRGGGGLFSDPIRNPNYDGARLQLQLSKQYGKTYNSDGSRWYLDPSIAYEGLSNPRRVMLQGDAGVALAGALQIGVVAGIGYLWAGRDECCSEYPDDLVAPPETQITDENDNSIGQIESENQSSPLWQITVHDRISYRTVLSRLGMDVGFKFASKWAFQVTGSWNRPILADEETSKSFTTFELNPQLIYFDPIPFYLQVSYLRGIKQSYENVGFMFGIAIDL